MSEKFSILRCGTDTKETGRNYPQVVEVVGGNFWQDGRPHSVRNLKYGMIPNDDFIDFGVLQLLKSSKMSDVISAPFPSADGFFMSNTTKTTFEQFKLGNHKFYPVSINHQGIVHDYFWLQLNNNFNPYIDFNKSQFHFEDTKNEILDATTLDNLMGLIEANLKSFKFIEYNKIFLVDTIPDIDIFGFSRLGTNLFITDRFKDAIKNNGLTGFEIKAQNKVL